MKPVAFLKSKMADKMAAGGMVIHISLWHSFLAPLNINFGVDSYVFDSKEFDFDLVFVISHQIMRKK